MGDKTLRFNTNTIDGSFAGGSSFSSSWRKYIRKNLAPNVISSELPRVAQEKMGVNITFFYMDIVGVNPHDNDPMVITVQQGNWDIKRVLIDPSNSTGVLVYDAFQKK